MLKIVYLGQTRSLIFFITSYNLLYHETAGGQLVMFSAIFMAKEKFETVIPLEDLLKGCACGAELGE